MLLSEPGLDLLIEQLRDMPSADRKAVLARLDPKERQRILKRLARRPARPADAVSPYSPDIAARLEASEEALTPAGRKALEAFLISGARPVMRADGHGASLAQAVAGLLRPLGRSR